MKELSKKDLNKVIGGIVPVIIGGVALYLIKDAWSHSDQIANGFKAGFQAGRK